MLGENQNSEAAEVGDGWYKLQAPRSIVTEVCRYHILPSMKYRVMDVELLTDPFTAHSEHYFLGIPENQAQC